MSRHNAETGASGGKVWGTWMIVAALLATAPAARAENGPSQFELYGFAMLDMGYETKQNDPAWFDVVRTTKLPSVPNEFGEDGRWFASVRQTRFGVKSTTPTDAGELKTIFEFELFGVGVDAGQTTIRLRHAYGELGHFGAGQTWSPFMDIDVFPNSVEYWGPAGMAFFRNVQVRWMPIQGDTRMTIALERPGASGDAGDFADRIQEQGVVGRFPLPDVSAEYRMAQPWGYIEGAGILRAIHWDDTNPAAPNLSGDATGWGINLSSNIKIANGTARLSIVSGEGIENYMNDAPADVAVDDSTAAEPEGVALPVFGFVAFYDHTWSDRWSSTIGYSSVEIDNSGGQSGTAFHRGNYGLVNLMHYPAKNVMVGAELQWGERVNKNEFVSNDTRIQFSAKYNFSTMLGGQ
jgi:hypothetical protein